MSNNFQIPSYGLQSLYMMLSLYCPINVPWKYQAHLNLRAFALGGPSLDCSSPYFISTPTSPKKHTHITLTLLDFFTFTFISSWCIIFCSLSKFPLEYKLWEQILCFYLLLYPQREITHHPTDTNKHPQWPSDSLITYLGLKFFCYLDSC